MAGSDVTTKVTLVADVGPYTRDLSRASTATTKLGGDIDRTSTKTSGFNKTVGQSKAVLLGLAAASAAVASTALVSFLADSVRAAGDLEQSVGGVDAVFKDGAESIHSFGENSAEAVGLSTNEFNQLATVTGALLKNSGIENFSQATLDLTTRAADVSATFGGTAKDAVEAFNAALRGESDPIERYGIKLNEAAVNAKVLEMGLGGLEGAQAEQAKVQARIQIIMDQSADSAGRFAAEASTLQGQQQRLNAEWENAKASLGQSLLPVMTDAAQAMRVGVDAGLALVTAFERIPSPVLAAAAALAAVHIAGGPVGRMAGTVRVTMQAAGEALSYARQSAEQAGGGFKGAAAGLSTFTGGATSAAGAMRGLRTAGAGLLGVLGGPWGIAFVAAAAVLTNYISNQREAAQYVQEHTDALRANQGVLSDRNVELVKNELISSGAADAAERLGIAQQDLLEAALGNADAQRRVNEVVGDGSTTMNVLRGQVLAVDGAMSLLDNDADLVRQTMIAQGAALNQAGRDAELYAQMGDGAAESATALGVASAEAGLQVGSLGDPVRQLNFEMGGLGQSILEMGEDTLDAATSVEALTNALFRQIDAAVSARDAESAYEAAVDALTASLEENGAASGFATEAGRANEDALTNTAKAAREHAQAQLESGASLSSVRASMAAARESFIAGAVQIGYTRTEAGALADQVGLTTRAVDAMNGEIASTVGKTVTVEAVGMDSSRAGIDLLQGEIQSTTSKTVTVTAAGPAAAATSVWNLANAISSLRDKTVTVTTVNRNVGVTSQRAVATGGMFYRAAGGVDELGRYYDRSPGFYGPQYGKTNMTWMSLGGAGMTRFGEPETKWEAYISGHPSHRSRNIGIALASLDKLGYRMEKAAAGDMRLARMSAATPSYPPAPAQSVDSGVTAQLASLSAAVASIPDRIVVPVSVGSRPVALASREGEAALGARSSWGNGKRLVT